MVLREAAYNAEAAAGVSACSTHARMCVMCMIWHTAQQISENRRFLANNKDVCIQPWTVNTHEWDPDHLIGPANNDGTPNGLVAHFPRWQTSHKWLFDEHNVRMAQK